MALVYRLQFVWPEGGGGRSIVQIIHAENRGEAGRIADEFWQSQTFALQPLGYDLYDQLNICVLKYRGKKAA